MHYPEVRCEKSGAILTLHLNRPDALNALNQEVRSGLRRGLEQAEGDNTCRVVVLRGEGRAFSVGQDLKELTEYYALHGPNLGALVEDEYIPIVRQLRRLSKPTVAVLEGVAVGGGMALALAADFRVITARAQLVPGFVNVALAPDTGTAFLLARAIGHARALSYCLLGQPIKAEAMVLLGLAESIQADHDALETTVSELTTRLAAGPTRAYAAIRRLYDDAAALPLEDVLTLERDVQDALAHTADHQDSIQAFLAKQTPVFRGV